MARSRSPSRAGGGVDHLGVEAVIIQSLVDRRQICRHTREYDKADEIRAQLRDMHVNVDDLELTWNAPGGLRGTVDNGGRPPPPGSKGSGKEGGKRREKGERRDGDWDCSGCGKVVFAGKEACFSCGAAKTIGAASHVSGSSVPQYDWMANIGKACLVLPEIQTPEQFNEMASQVKDVIGKLPPAFLSGFCSAAARVTHFDPELVAQLLPTVANILKLQVNGVGASEFSVAHMVEIVCALSTLNSPDFIIFDSVTTILLEQMDSIDATQCPLLIQAYSSTGDLRHNPFVNLLQKHEKQSILNRCRNVINAQLALSSRGR